MISTPTGKAIFFASPLYVIYGTRFLHPAFWLSSPIGMWFEQIFLVLVLPASCLSLIHAKAGIQPFQYGLFRPAKIYRKDEFAAWAIITTTAFLSYIVVYAIVRSYADDLLSGPQLGAPYPTGWSRFPVVITLACVVGFFEEIFYRGVLAMLIAPSGANTFRKTLYVVASSLLFGLEHAATGLPGFLATAYLGAIAALLYLRIGNLWPLIIAHAITGAIVDIWSH